jgi:hypothetical protein
VVLPPQLCRVELATHSVVECHSGEGPMRARDPAPDLVPPGPLPAGKGQFAIFQSDCGGGDQWFFATGAQDYSQMDSLQAFRMKAGGAVAVSRELNFPGPIVGLHAASGPPRIVVRNLKTGNYEAYRLSVSCGQ